MAGGGRAESAAERLAESAAERLAESTAEGQAESAAEETGRIGRGVAGRIYRASRISGNMPCRASERGFPDPDIARSTEKDGTAQAS